MAIHGRVIRIEPALGFGFIRDDSDGDWFFVATACAGGLDALWVGERVASGPKEWTAQRAAAPPTSTTSQLASERRGLRPAVLFDIDGTLVLTGGAGKRAMDRAFEEAFGVADAFADIPMGGRTDRFLIERGLERWGMPATAAALEACSAAATSPTWPRASTSRARHEGTMPGVARCSMPSTRRPASTRRCSPATTRRRAHQADPFGLWDRFAWGAFGDDRRARRARPGRGRRRAAPGRDAGQSTARGHRRRHPVRHRLRQRRRGPGGGGGHRRPRPRRAAGPRPGSGRRDLDELDAVLALVDGR